MHQRFELRRARERPLDAVAHRRDLAADRLADADDRFAGERFRFSEPHRRVGHGAGDETQFLRAAEHVRQQEEECDRHAEGDRKPVELQAVVADRLAALGEMRQGKQNAGGNPGQRQQSGKHIRSPRPSALQAVEHAPDRLAIVVGGRRLRRLRLLAGRGRLLEEQLLVDHRARAAPAALAAAVDRVDARGLRAPRRRFVALAHAERVLNRRQRCLCRVVHLPRGVCHGCPSALPTPTTRVAAARPMVPGLALHAARMGSIPVPYPPFAGSPPARPIGHPIGLTHRMKPRW